MTYLLIAVTLISSAGWLLGLAFSLSAARRHLILITALVACLSMPVALYLRSATDWALLEIRSTLVASESVNHGLIAADRVLPAEDHQADRTWLDPESLRASAYIFPADKQNKSTMPEESPQEPPGIATSERENVAEVKDTRSSLVEAASPTNTSKLQSAGRIGAILYFLVAGALVLRLVVGVISMRRIVKRASEVSRLPNGIRIMEGDVAVPLAIGFVSRAILLPRGFQAEVDPNQLRDILTHENEHLRRGDHWVLLLQQIAAALYWPIVTVHLLNRALGGAREELCDNAVLTQRDATEYGQTLLTLAEQAQGGHLLAAHWVPSVMGRGDLERRVAGLLDIRRDRRTGVSRAARLAVAVLLVIAVVFAGTTRVVAVAEESLGDEVVAAEPATDELPASGTNITWTGIPKVSLEDPTLHRGVVLAPDGKPLPGAKVYAASTIELLEMASEDKVAPEDLGPVRAVTDQQGRFEFHAEDISWVTTAGERRRWETLLVATKEGVPPAWLRTWGADRSPRDHWHPMQGSEVAIRTRQPATLTGNLSLEGDSPLAGAKVRLTGLMAPIEYDLEKHIPREEVKPLGLFATIDYAEHLYRPWVLPGIITEVTTNEDGLFELPGLPEGFIASLEFSHPQAVTSNMRVAIRALDPVYRDPPFGQGEPSVSLRGSGFKLKLAECGVLRGQVVSDSWGDHSPASGVVVALANHNAKGGVTGQRFVTDDEGRFEVTGLAKRAQGYELAFVGSFDGPFDSLREQVVPGAEVRIELPPAVPYRLKLVDPAGNPVNRSVSSVQVQSFPNTVRKGVKGQFNQAERVAPGLYEGILPTGPGAVLVKRGAMTDRPAAVDPKEFFAPGRKDWTLEEERFAYGDEWRIATTVITTVENLSVGRNWTTDQLDQAAIVLTNASKEDGVLELTATVYSDSPVEVKLVDEAGNPVEGASLERQLKRYNGEGLPASVLVYGLHPERAEFLQFKHEERGLLGTLRATWSQEPVQVVMHPTATLLGRVTNESGTPDRDFSIRIISEGVMPDTSFGGRVFNTTDKPGERPGEFRLELPPGVEVRGEFVRRMSDQATRPSAGTAFGPLTLQAGETKELGDLVVP